MLEYCLIPTFLTSAFQFWFPAQAWLNHKWRCPGAQYSVHVNWRIMGLLWAVVFLLTHTSMHYSQLLNTKVTEISSQDTLSKRNKIYKPEICLHSFCLWSFFLWEILCLLVSPFTVLPIRKGKITSRWTTLTAQKMMVSPRCLPLPSKTQMKRTLTWGYAVTA